LSGVPLAGGGASDPSAEEPCHVDVLDVDEEPSELVPLPSYVEPLAS